MEKFFLRHSYIELVSQVAPTDVPQPVYLDKTMFKHILRHVEADTNKMALGFPSLIFGILVK